MAYLRARLRDGSSSLSLISFSLCSSLDSSILFAVPALKIKQWLEVDSRTIGGSRRTWF